MKKLLCAVLSGIMAFSTFAVAVPITASAAESQESVSATYGDFEYTSKMIIHARLRDITVLRLMLLYPQLFMVIKFVR